MTLILSIKSNLQSEGFCSQNRTRCALPTLLLVHVQDEHRVDSASTLERPGMETSCARLGCVVGLNVARVPLYVI